MLVSEIDVRQFSDFADHERVVSCFDPDTGLRAYIAIHSTRLGPALGGCRMYPYTSDDDAVKDVLRLSRGMTYKSAMAGIPLGGGKAVIVGNPATDKSRGLFQAMGRFINTLNGDYVTAEDSGTTVADLQTVATVCKFVSGVELKIRGAKTSDGDPSPSTAQGVYHGIKSMVATKFGSDELGSVTVAVQGVGNVGQHLVNYLSEAGAKILVGDIRSENLEKVAALPGVSVVSNDTIMSAECDVYSPCAMGGSLSTQSIETLQATIIAGAANNQLRETSVGLALHQKGKLYAPDYVINAGGIIDIYYEQTGYSFGRVQSHIEGIGNQLSEICRQSKFKNLPTNIIADQMAEQILRTRKLPHVA